MDDMKTKKKCSTCGQRKPRSEFYRSKKARDGLAWHCKPCNKARAHQWRRENPQQCKDIRRRCYIRKTYDLSVEEYEALVAKGCAICGKHVTPMHLDHNHETGELREALCPTCNHTLGLINDDPERADRMAEYLRRHG